MDINDQPETLGTLSRQKYAERVGVIKYSITFSAAAVAFLVTAKTQLGVNLENEHLRVLLGLWGINILSGFGEYILSYREVWYHKRLPDGWRKKIIPAVELCLLYGCLVLHPLTMFGAIGTTVVFLWKALA